MTFPIVLNPTPRRTVQFLMALLLLPLLQACETYFYLDYAARNAVVTHSWQQDVVHTRVPFRLLNNHILIPVNINGTQLEFVFDTGAGATAIFNTNATQNMHWDDGATSTVSDNTDNASEMRFVHGMDVKVGDLTLHALSGLYLPDLSRLGVKGPDGIYFDGILGQDHLERFVVEINYDTNELIFYEQNYFDEAVKQEKLQWQRIPLHLEGTEPFVDLSLTAPDGQIVKTRVLLDTGSVGSLSLRNSTVKGFPIPAGSYETSSFGVGGEKVSTVSVLSQAFIGEQALSDILVRIPNSHDGKDLIEYGLLGNGIMSRFNILLDYKNEQVYFQKNSRFAMKALPDRSGLTLRPHRNGAIVSTVRAQASSLGLQRFDVITSYNGIDITYQNYNTLLWLLSSDEPHISLCWENESGQQCGKLTLRNRLK